MCGVGETLVLNTCLFNKLVLFFALVQSTGHTEEEVSAMADVKKREPTTDISDKGGALFLITLGVVLLASTLASILGAKAILAGAGLWLLILGVLEYLTPWGSSKTS